MHEVAIAKGVRIERHLCEICAQQQGLMTTSPLPAPVTELLSHFTTIASQTGPSIGQVLPRPGPDMCPSCGMTFAQFRQAERLGCADCYAALEKHLGPLLERVHEGSSQHVGKVPRRLMAQAQGAGSPPERASRLPSEAMPPAQAAPKASKGPSRVEVEARMGAVRAQLDDAVRAERYEQAAKLRDELARLAALLGGECGT